MFERFTDRARAVVVHGQEAAVALKHNYIGTEHLLLGLLNENAGIAAKALRSLGVTPETAREQVEEIIGQGHQTPSGHIPLTPRTKKVMKLALREALQLGHNYIGAEHILLAVAGEGEGVGAQVLVRLGADLNRVRQQVLQLLSWHAAASESAEPGSRRTGVAEDAVSAAQHLAGGAPVGSHHLLEALANAEGSMAARVLAELGVDADTIAAKVDALDPDETTDATPEFTAASKMELRVEGNEAHIVLRDAATVGLARAVTEHTGGPLIAEGPLAGAFLRLWTATNTMLDSLHRSLQDDESADDLDSASTLARRVLRGRMRRRRRR